MTIRLKPYEEAFTGKVSAVLQQFSGTQGSAALYTALNEIDPTEKQLLPGMIGQAEIAIPNAGNSSLMLRHATRHAQRSTRYASG